MTDKEKAIAMAKSKIGMTNTEVGKAYSEYTGKSFDGEGCTEFFVMNQIWAGNEELIKPFISNYCYGLYSRMQAKQLVDQNPRLGDAVFFNYNDGVGLSHTGMIVDMDSTRIYTVEGNIKVNGTAQVVSRSYLKTCSYLAAFGHVPYTEREELFDTMNIWDAKKGDNGGWVAAAQALLNTKNSAGLVVDGDYGNYTEAAVKAYQLKRGLDVTGIVDADTWAALITQDV